MPNLELEPIADLDQDISNQAIPPHMEEVMAEEQARQQSQSSTAETVADSLDVLDLIGGAVETAVDVAGSALDVVGSVAEVAGDVVSGIGDALGSIGDLF